MRQIATSGDEAAVRKFCDYLLTLKIATRLLPDGEETGMWVCDEDKVDLARQEYQRFLQEPGDPRYDRAPVVARELRRKEERREKDYRVRTTRLRDRMDGVPTAADRPLTIALIVVAVLVTLGSNFSSDKSAVTQALSIAPFEVAGKFTYWDRLGAISSGEVWRVLTPIFLHFDILHLVFNAMMMLSLGGRVESSRGTLRFLALVLVLAAASNVCEYYLHWDIGKNPPLSLRESPRFGGLSGVIYGLLGYAWMKMRFAPELGLGLSRETILIMLGWFVLCLVGLIGSVANVAHASGLILGMVIGALPRMWKR
jgi:GlpG protein